MDAHVSALEQRGFAWVREALPSAAEALDRTVELIAARCALDETETPRVIGDFIVPPPEGSTTRDFQTLHFDFGVPLEPEAPRDLARYTALHVPRGTQPVATTRLVPIHALLSQRDWPPRHTLVQRFISYGQTHGTWEGEIGYVEGSLARIVEAAAGLPLLPSVKSEPEFLCGMEFDSLRAEAAFFERHAVPLEGVETEIALNTGELLIFDNLSLAHGRRGTRQPGELCQWVFGDRSLDVATQRAARERILQAFDTEPTLSARQPRPDSRTTTHP